MKTVNIFGEVIEAKQVKERNNVIIVEDLAGDRHVVHKSTIRNTKRTKGRNDPAGSFDLAECQRIGRTGRKARKKGY